MRTKRQLEERNFKRATTALEYRRKNRRSSSGGDKGRDNGELLEAASIMLTRALERTKQRDALHNAVTFNEAKNGIYNPNVDDYEEVGYPEGSRNKPDNWPLNDGEWGVYNQRQMLLGAAELILAEYARVAKVGDAVREYDFGALDPEFVELADKAIEIRHARQRKQWKLTENAIDLLAPIRYTAGIATPTLTINGASSGSNAVTAQATAAASP